MTDPQILILYMNVLLSIIVTLFGIFITVYYYVSENKLFSILSGLITIIMIYVTVTIFMTIKPYLN